MMATEATSGNSADASNTVETEPINLENQDVNLELLPMNGEIKSDEPKSYAEFSDRNVYSAEVSVSGGSDTEATKAETSKGQPDEKGHVRSASTVKRLISFKPVSVNKTFLRAQGSTPVKPGDKGSIGSVSFPVTATTSATPRPRLVAKTGSGLRDSAPRAATIPNGGKIGIAPDPNVVWNKNRPAPQPEQKRITDEELKQQYGIHLATRLQSDDPGKQANWADIDDDDDDWAPESIEWTDGTKITLPQADEVVPVLTKTAILLPIAKPLSTDSPKSKSPTPQLTTPSNVKLGVISSASGKGLILKGVAERPTLVAKPPGPPAPVKSPWAPLPPVEKVATIAVEAQQPQQQQQPASRFSQKDAHGFDNIAPPPAAKEIAADDFSRSWRDAGTNANKELFNSQSGRYEPVNDGRKGSARSDIQSRQPALLQRPSQHDQQGPAEPSAAFQTHRASGQDGGYGRRRTSSTVSGGSGSLARRMSKGQDGYPGHEMVDARRGSLVAVTDLPASPNNVLSSLNQPNHRGNPPQQWQSRASPSISQGSPASAHGQIAIPNVAQPAASAFPIEDEVELQKKIMRESRELARKRRLDEEAREEAERKERIRLKLEAMGPPPENKRAKKDFSKEDRSLPPQTQAWDAIITTSPPKPHVPEVAGEIRQYGRMKVHPPDIVAAETKATQMEERPPPNDTALNDQPDALTSEITEIKHVSNDIRQQSTWQNPTSTGGDRYSAWTSPTTHSNQGRSVWGPPTNDRTLGNGTFNPDLSRLPEISGPQQSQTTSSDPGPIGPPNSNKTNGPYQNRVREQYLQRPAPIGPPHRQHQQASVRDQQRAQATAAWNSLPEKLSQENARARAEHERQDTARRELQASGVDTPKSQPAPQPVYKDTWKKVAVNDDGQRVGTKVVSQTIHDGANPSATAGWKDLAIQLGQDEVADDERNDPPNTSWRHHEPASTNVEPPQPTYKDKWRHTQLENGVRNDSLGTPSMANSTNSTTGAVRTSSRFFPQTKDIRLEDPLTSITRPGSSSPPPPTMVGHPAYDGDTVRPQVSLPRPPPVVRLPPPRILAPIGPPKPIASFAAAAAAPVAPVIAPSSSPVSYPLRNQDDRGRYKNDQIGPSRLPQGPGSEANWQDRINHLIGRRSSPPKIYALAVDSSSKSALELPISKMSALVSLPSSPLGNMSEYDSFETKPMAEECFEEQEMGSLPPIKVPSKAPEAAWHLAVSQTKPLPRKFVLNHVTSADSIMFSAQVTNNGSNIHIFLPGMTSEVCINVPPKREARQNSNGRRQGHSRGGVPRHISSNHPRNGRSRDPSTGFPSPSLEDTSISSSPTLSNRGGSRSRGNLGPHWNNHRHVSTPTSAINV